MEHDLFDVEPGNEELQEISDKVVGGWIPIESVESLYEYLDREGTDGKVGINISQKKVVKGVLSYDKESNLLSFEFSDKKTPSTKVDSYNLLEIYNVSLCDCSKLGKSHGFFIKFEPNENCKLAPFGLPPGGHPKTCKVFWNYGTFYCRVESLGNRKEPE